MYRLRTVRKCLETLNERNASIVLILLLSSDFVLITLHLINAKTSFLSNPWFSIERDGGYPEIFQYLKFLLIITVLIQVLLKNKSLSYIPWILTFTYFLCDDSLKIHELIGRRIGENLSFAPPFGLRLQDFGEITVSVTVGFFLFVLLLQSYKKGTAVFRKVSKDIALLIFVLVFFGIIADMAHVAIKRGPDVKLILGIIEDGGEMLSVSLILWYTVLLKTRRNNTGYYLCDLVNIVLTGRST